ncbi:response regulator transcription factor [Maribacter algarum]|uniref:Response regulator transcription factor n=1 Tax=Maribacter algarum (ex Zhang et al. 2020) TaxID=2578118 RepID=A0A5S3PTK4_9FLAO|nr:LytTR family DNA-binding domain-containing protein [Maribacter algarum]TMM58315.1 response regulator transcription factor [Maribacter algarum]
MTTKCIIVDDEPLGIEVIENYLIQLDGYEIKARCKNAIEAFSILEKHEIDLMFLDIQMPKLTGIEFLKSLKHPPQVILTTAYIDYAVESYELDILDYLVKPISFERFLKSITKYAKQNSGSQQTISATTTIKNVQDYIYVRADKKKYKILFANILYIESVKDYVKIHLINKRLMVKTTLIDFEQQLPSESFLRIHRSYVVNLNHITAHTLKDVEIGEIEIPIGVSYKQSVFEKLR